MRRMAIALVVGITIIFSVVVVYMTQDVQAIGMFEVDVDGQPQIISRGWSAICQFGLLMVVAGIAIGALAGWVAGLRIWNWFSKVRDGETERLRELAEKHLSAAKQKHSEAKQLIAVEVELAAAQASAANRDVVEVELRQQIAKLEGDLAAVRAKNQRLQSRARKSEGEADE